MLSVFHARLQYTEYWYKERRPIAGLAAITQPPPGSSPEHLAYRCPSHKTRSSTLALPVIVGHYLEEIPT